MLKSSPNKMFYHILISLFFAYLFLVLYMYIFQESYIYFPDNQDFDSCEGFKNSEKINYKSTRMYYKNNSDKLIVFYHGNAGSVCDRAYMKEKFDQYGVSYIFVEYAGYSNDNKNPTKKLLLNDVKNVNEFLETINYKELIFMGQSLGSGMASYHSTLRKPDKILLISPFSTLADLGQKAYPYLPVKLLLRNNYDNILWLKDYNNKIIILHGDKDKTIPQSLSKKLFDNLNTKDKKYILINGADHNDMYLFPDMWNNIKTFINEK